VKRGLHIISLAGLLICCEDEEPTRLALAGNWKIDHVVYDGSVQSEWDHLDFVFEQTSATGGIYRLPNTPYDTIWKHQGTWNLSNSPDQITFDNFLDANYAVFRNELEFVTYLPWTSTSTCDNGVCLPVVTGQWSFTLKR
jgi:hypothetical protein